MSVHWYALQSKPRKEEALWRQVQASGVEAYYPSLRVRPVNPRARKIRPYFPGYLFIRTDLEVTGLSSFQWMPQAVGLVSFGGIPAPVPDALIISIRHLIDALTESGTQWYDELAHGDQVRIQSGPFAGYEAMFDIRLSGSERVRVLLQLLSGQNVALELDAAQLDPTGHRYIPKQRIQR